MSYYTVDDERVEFASQVAELVFDEDDIPEDEFDEYLDEVCSSVEIFGSVFFPSEILKECDKTAYRCYFNDWADAEVTSRREDIEYDIERHYSLYDGQTASLYGHEIVYHEDDEEDEDEEEDGEDEVRRQK